jgi:hypothetical protein
VIQAELAHMSPTTPTGRGIRLVFGQSA